MQFSFLLLALLLLMAIHVHGKRNTTKIKERMLERKESRKAGSENGTKYDIADVINNMPKADLQELLSKVPEHLQNSTQYLSEMFSSSLNSTLNHEAVKKVSQDYGGFFESITGFFSNFSLSKALNSKKPSSRRAKRKSRKEAAEEEL
jgi:transcription elongation factor GreA-like protein